MLSTRSATALYVGAVLGPGVLLLPAAGRRGRRAGVGARVGRRCSRCRCRSRSRSPRSACASRRRAARPRTRAPRSGARAGAVTGWWFLAGVVLGAPAVALIGGFYVAELLGAGREAAVVAAAAMVAAVMAANALGVHTTARLQLGLAGVLAALLLVAVVSALPREPRGELDAVRAARLGRGRHGREPADALVHRLGGRLAPGRRAARPGAPAPARDLRRARASSLVLYLGLAAATIGVLGTAAPLRRPARRPDGRRARRRRAHRHRRCSPCC